MLLNLNKSISKIFDPNQKGYTLLFAVLVATIVLGVASFILSISRKQFILSSSARDSLYALYSADSGVECAVEDLTPFQFITNVPNPTPSITCGGSTVSLEQSLSNGISTTDFYLYTGGVAGGNQTTQSGESSCVSVKVQYEPKKSVSSLYYDVTTVTSNGYNIGYNGTDCSKPGARKVERTLQYILQAPVSGP